MCDTVQLVDNTSSESTSADGIGLQQDTSATINNDASTRTSTDICTLGLVPLNIIKWKLVETTSIRFFAGLAGDTNPNTADDVGASVGIQFSTARPDTNFQFMTDDGATQTLVDSGIAIDTAIHFVKIDAASATSVKVSLLDVNFAEQASTTFTTQLPASTISMQVFSGVRNLTASVRSIVQFYATLLLRNS